ncbi:MAG: substrate-binding domain-containing protein [Chitinispirillia bacterium]|nr:substrate-binding domain-containing protein [Chitinispirillia bacterium]MCL2242502.1 substrate-binding domain-containing protein [Chitinispirillia bacterium]
MKKVLLAVLGAGLILGAFTGCGKKGDDVNGEGGKQREITVISREESSGTRGAFDELMKITDGKTNMLFREAVIVSSTDEAASKVEVDKFAIGYTSLGSVTSKVKALTIDGVVPNEENVKNGSYKIARPFVLAVKIGSGNQLAKDFLKFVSSQSGQAVVSKAGYITVDAAADYTPAKLSGKLTLSGSTSVEKVIQKLKEEYEGLNPGAKLEINYNGSSAGIKDCLADKSDVAMSSRELKAEEKDQITGTTFALDGIAVIVNQSNEVSNMTEDLVTKIFKGEARFWNDVQ